MNRPRVLRTERVWAGMRAGPARIALLSLGLVVGLGSVACRAPQPAPVPDPNRLPPTPLAPPVDAAEFLGSAACAECHRAEFDSHRRAPHSTTLAFTRDSPALQYFRGDKIQRDRALQAVYAAGQRDGTPLFRAAKEGTDMMLEWEPQITVGSGRFAYTFLTETDGQFLECRVSYYPGHRRWNWTPGQQDETPDGSVVGRPMNDQDAQRCLLCHSTVVPVKEGHPDVSRILMGVGCERCHGPGRDHVAAARAGSRRPGRLHGYRGAGAETILELCSTCHRGPDHLPREGIERNPQLARFQGTALSLSECYRKSNGRLTCTTCHNPHAPVDRRPAVQETTCRGCHTGTAPTSPACPVNPTFGCIPCHMPKVSLGEPMQLAFHQHWIRAGWKKPSPSAGVSHPAASP